MSTCRNSIDALSWVSNRMLGTPSLTAKPMLIGERVQNFRCRQPEGSGSSEKGCPKSITVTTGPPSGFKTSPRPPKKCQPIKPTTVASATSPIRKYRDRKVSCLYTCVQLPHVRHHRRSERCVRGQGGRPRGGRES